MPAFQQPSTTVNPPLPAGTLPTSPGYSQNLVNQFATQMKPQYQQAERDLRSNIRSSRGLADSGIEASEQGGLAQNRLAQVGDYASALGQNQANMNEAERVRQELRGFQTQDIGTQFAHQQQLTADERAYQQQQQQAQQWGQLLQAAGTVAMMA